MGAGLWNRGNVLVGLYGMWQDGPKPRPAGSPHLWGTRIDLGLILSNDGVHFREPVPDFKVIPRGKEGEWDSIALCQGHAFANVGEKTYLWYSHWDCEQEFRHQEIGLATLRRDGFGYLSRHQADAEGLCISATIPASPHGYKLQVNVEGIASEHPLTVELLDELGRAVPGYSGKDAAKITQPGVARDVVWPGQGGSLTPRDCPLAVQIGLPSSGDVRLYAVYAVPAPRSRE
jgi:hypothetical protein